MARMGNDIYRLGRNLAWSTPSCGIWLWSGKDIQRNDGIKGLKLENLSIAEQLQYWQIFSFSSPFPSAVSACTAEGKGEVKEGEGLRGEGDEEGLKKLKLKGWRRVGERRADPDQIGHGLHLRAKFHPYILSPLREEKPSVLPFFNFVILWWLHPAL